MNAPLDDTQGVRPLVAVLDYGIGNVHSAHKAVERMGADARLTTMRRSSPTPTVWSFLVSARSEHA